jgi:hypothetical protein
MSSSWDLGRDNFYATLTNSSSLNIFPNNHPAEFQVLLNQNFILDPEEWEVSLANIHYVHDFPNIGESTFIKFRHRGEVYTLDLPQWYCQKLEDMGERNMGDLLHFSTLVFPIGFSGNFIAKNGSLGSDAIPGPLGC